MSTEENKKVVLAYFEQRSAGNPHAFDNLADSATWMIMAKGPMGGTKTKAELLQILAGVTARFEAPVTFKVMASPRKASASRSRRKVTPS